MLRRRRKAKKNEPIDSSMLPFGKAARVRDDAYKRSAEQRPCDACGHGGDGSVVLAHISIDGNAGTGIKAPDDQAAFLCDECHREFDTQPDKWRWLVTNVLLPMLRKRHQDWRVNKCQ